MIQAVTEVALAAIWPEQQLTCSRCFCLTTGPVTRAEWNGGSPSPSGTEAICHTCQPLLLAWPGKIPITDLMTREHAKALQAKLGNLGPLTPTQLRVYYCVYNGFAREEDREACTAAVSWGAPRLSGAWFGEVGKRYRDVGVKCLGVKWVGLGEHGDRYRADLEVTEAAKGTEAPLLVWWSGENMWVKAGKGHVCDFTVKEHTSFNGVKQTIIQRVTGSDDPKWKGAKVAKPAPQ